MFKLFKKKTKKVLNLSEKDNINYNEFENQLQWLLNKNFYNNFNKIGMFHN